MHKFIIKRNEGFTLIELLVVIGIIAITMGIGLPGFQSSIASSRLTSSANNMVVALQLARSEAIKQNILAGVSIDATNGAWFVFDNVTSNSVQQYKIDNGVTVNIAFPTSGGTLPTYRPDGRVNNGTTYILQFTVAGGSDSRILTLQPSGRVNICTPVLPGPDANCHT